MMKPLFISVALLLIATHVFGQAQDTVYGPEPKGGINALVLPFYKIKFSREQRNLLKRKDIELIFSVDEQGKATLEDIKGVLDASIQDSLHRTSAKVPLFHPRTVNGASVSALFFLQFQFPYYSPHVVMTQEHTLYSYKEYAFEDFEYIHKSGERLDMVIGAMGNAFIGSPGDYLQPGGGMRTEVMYTGKKGFGGSLHMSFYGNKSKQDYPIGSGREQNSAPPTLLLGMGLNKSLRIKDTGGFVAQVELNYALQNITPKLGDDDQDWVQLRGISPGFVLNYFVKIAKDRAVYSYGSPSVLNHNLNIHGAVRPVFFNLKAASGIMLEAGLSWRLNYHFVDEFRVRQQPQG